MRVCVGQLEDKPAVRSKCKNTTDLCFPGSKTKNCVLRRKCKLMRVFCEFLGPVFIKKKSL